MQSPLDPQALERDLLFATETARLAGERVLALRTSGRWEDSLLADIGDQAADGFLQGAFLGRYPDDGILSEETVDSPERLAKRRVWILDPLDGTKEFSQGRDDWAVHVALCIDGKPVLGAVALPALGEVLHGIAVPGHEHAGSSAGALLLPGGSPQGAKPRVVVSRSHTPPWVERFAESFGAELLPCGSAGYKVSRLLLGEADMYVHKVGLKEWDTCAPEVVARALGWTVCKLDGAEHVYNRRDPKNHELVVCRPALRERVVEALKGV